MITTLSHASPLLPLQSPSGPADRTERNGSAGTACPPAPMPPVTAYQQILLRVQTQLGELAQGREGLQKLIPPDPLIGPAVVSKREGVSSNPIARAPLAKKNMLTGLRAEIEGRVAEIRVNGDGLSKMVMGLAASQQPLTEQQRQLLSNVLPSQPQARATAADNKIIADSELWQLIADAIAGINQNYLGVYEDAVALYTEFYKEFSNILSQLGSWISASNNGNDVTLNVTALRNALTALKDKFKDQPLFTGTEEAARQWAAEMGLPPASVQSDGNGGFKVVIDMGPIQSMIDNLPANGTMNNAAFQAWQSGFKAQEENLKNTLQTLTQKYSNANALYDNLVKVLSSTISSCLETAKSFLQG